MSSPQNVPHKGSQSNASRHPSQFVSNDEFAEWRTRHFGRSSHRGLGLSTMLGVETGRIRRREAVCARSFLWLAQHCASLIGLIPLRDQARARRVAYVHRSFPIQQHELQVREKNP